MLSLLSICPDGISFELMEGGRVGTNYANSKDANILQLCENIFSQRYAGGLTSKGALLEVVICRCPSPAAGFVSG